MNTNMNTNKLVVTLSKYRNILTALFAALAVILMFLWFHQKSAFIYQTNDDLFFKTIASGEISGTPDPRLYYIGFPAGLLVSTLYKLLPALPWYGLFLCFSFGLTLCIVLYKLLQLEQKLWTKLLTTALFVLFTYSFLFIHVCELQFTAVTGMAGAGAVFLFALADTTGDLKQTLRNNLGFLLLSCFAFSIREKGFLMLFPFIGMIGLGKYLLASQMKQTASEKENTENEQSVSKEQNTIGIPVQKKPGLLTLTRPRQNLFILAGIFLLLIGLLYGLEKAAYSSDEWKSFRAYTDASETIYDYAGYPDYDTYADLYAEMGITRSSYEAAAHHYNILLEPAINEENMVRLAAIAEENIGVTSSGLAAKLKEMTAFFIDRHLSYTDRPLNLLVYSLYFVFLLLALLGRRWIVLRDLSFLFIARMAVWTYLVYYGRLPSRVSQSVYFAELVLLLAIAFGQKLWEKRKICWTICMCILVLICFRFGIPKTHAAIGEANMRCNFSNSFLELKEYFADHPENFYYLDMNSFGSFTEEPLTCGENTYGNYLFMGSWVPNSPWYQAKWDRQGITDPAGALLDDPGVYAVFMKTPDTGWEYLNDFYEENFDAHIELITEFSTSNDITFEIVKGVR